MNKDSSVSYTNDIAIFSTGNTCLDTQDKMNEYLKQNAMWLAVNKLSLNIDEILFITFGKYSKTVPKNVNK